MERKKNKKKKSRMVWIILSVLAVLMVSVIVFLNQPKFGRLPRGERLERIKNSPNYRDGKFQNLSKTQQITSDKGFLGTMSDFLFQDRTLLSPKTDVPVVVNDLWKLDRSKDVMIWFGHSSYLIQVDGKRILVDPVFVEAAPVGFVNKPFPGTDKYKPEDIPEVDYLIISHDHWDHLDYKTVMQLKDRIGKVVCGLGVGEHFEYWGFDKDRIVELDWNEEASLDEFTIYCLPARHFSGRGLSPNQTLWASYMVVAPSQTIYIGGDGGYDTHFTEIAKRFPKIDLAILENGQYNEDWRYIHILPEQLPQVAKDLNANRFFTVHHSKYALARHPWQEPVEKIVEAARKDSLPLVVASIGEVVELKSDALSMGDGEVIQE